MRTFRTILLAAALGFALGYAEKQKHQQAQPAPTQPTKPAFKASI